MPDGNKLMGKFKVIATSLKWLYLSGENNSVVIQRIVAMLNKADTEMRKKMESMKTLAPFKVLGAVIIESWFEIKDQELVEDDTDVYVIELLKNILRLECFWVHRGLPDSKMSVKDAFPSLLADQKEFEEALETVELGIKYLTGPNVNMKETNEYKAMDSKINELWNRIEESEKEKGQKSD